MSEESADFFAKSSKRGKKDVSEEMADHPSGEVLEDDLDLSLEDTEELFESGEPAKVVLPPSTPDGSAGVSYRRGPGGALIPE